MLRIDLGCGTRKQKDFVGVDIMAAPGVDIVANLNQKFPFDDNSVDEIRAYDVIEHLPDKMHTMNEIWRVCKPGALVDIRVPSTDGRGAFQDPTHVSFWNINSFFYYCVDFPGYWELCQQYGFQGAFKVVTLEHEESPDRIVHVSAQLRVLKLGYNFFPDGGSSVQQVSNSTDVQVAPREKITQSATVPNFNLAALVSQVEQYQQNPRDKDALANLRMARQLIANQLLEVAADQLESLYLGDVGRAHKVLLESNLKHELLTETEQVFVEELTAGISRGFDSEKAIAYLLAGMLYIGAHQLPLQPGDLTNIPRWILNEYLKFVLAAPRYFLEVGEADKYYQYLQKWVNYIHGHIAANAESKFSEEVAYSFLQNAGFLQAYFNEANLKNIYVQRAEILEYLLRIRGYQIDGEFSGFSPTPRKLRLGILAGHFLPAAETFAALPIYEYISRDFEVILYSLRQTGHPLEEYCQSCANSFKLLPNQLTDQVNLIRDDELDILFIATNITVTTNEIFQLASHRLARIQVTSVASVVTTGIRNIDYYISGKLTDPAEDAQQHYQEKLLKIDGSAHCFSYGSEVETATIKVERENLAIAKETIVFTSGANWFKIIPELRHTWAKILAAVPNSVLVLYPWGPNWSNNYPKQSFSRNFNQIFAQYGVEPDRLIILDPYPVPNRDDIKEYLKLADVYLDSHPFSGTTSIIDPLEVGIPVVARQGKCFRSAMGAALLLELGMPDLVVPNEESYIQLAIALGNEPQLRQQKSAEIQQKMRLQPRFLDSRAYSTQIGALFQDIIREYWANAVGEDLKLRDINLIVFPDWSQSEEFVASELAGVMRAIATHPQANQITLLVDTSNIAEEDANLAVSGVVMNLLMEEELDVSDGAEISFTGKLTSREWSALLPRLQARIALACDNEGAIAAAKAENLSSYTPDKLP